MFGWCYYNNHNIIFESQELFKVKVGETVSADNPHKVLQKKEIIEDIEKRGVVSDFFPAKEKIKVWNYISLSFIIPFWFHWLIIKYNFLYK